MHVMATVMRNNIETSGGGSSPAVLQGKQIMWISYWDNNHANYKMTHRGHIIEIEIDEMDDHSKVMHHVTKPDGEKMIAPLCSYSLNPRNSKDAYLFVCKWINAGCPKKERGTFDKKSLDEYIENDYQNQIQILENEGYQNADI